MHVDTLVLFVERICRRAPRGLEVSTILFAPIHAGPSKILRVLSSFVSCRTLFVARDDCVPLVLAQDFYQALYTQSQAQFDTYVGSGTILNNYAHIFDVSTRDPMLPPLFLSNRGYTMFGFESRCRSSWVGWATRYSISE